MMVTHRKQILGRDIAKVLQKVSYGYSMTGEKRRATAFDRAAQTLRMQMGTKNFSQSSLADILKLEGVGKSIATTIVQIAETGKCDRLDTICSKGNLPTTIFELLEVEGIGPATAKSLWEEYGITCLADFMKRLGKGEFDKGGKFLKRAKKALLNTERIPREALVAALRPRLRKLKALPFVKKVEVAGSIRRKRATVKDADVLVCLERTNENVEALTKACARIFGAITSGGNRKLQTTVIVGEGERNVDVLMTTPDCWGVALNYFTGSREHNIQLRKLALKEGLKVNEYGIWKGKKRVGGKDEKDLYRLLNISYVTPQKR